MVGDFASDTVMYKTIEGGYDQILTCLGDAFLQKRGKIYTHNRLETFKKNPDHSSQYRYILSFYNDISKESWEVKAKDIILAMPRKSLELLDQENFFFDRDTQKDLQYNMASVIIEPSYKILLGYFIDLIRVPCSQIPICCLRSLSW